MSGSSRRWGCLMRGDEEGVKGEPSMGSTLAYVVQPQAPKENDDRFWPWPKTGQDNKL